MTPSEAGSAWLALLGLLGLIGLAGLAGIRQPVPAQQPGAGIRWLGVLGLALVGVAQVAAFVAPAAGPLAQQAARRAGAPSSSHGPRATQPLVPIASPSSLLSAVSEP